MNEVALPHLRVEEHIIGVFQDSQLLLNEHMEAAARKAFAQLQLYQLCPFLDWKGLQRIIHTLVTFQLDYYNVLKWDCSRRPTESFD